MFKKLLLFLLIFAVLMIAFCSLQPTEEHFDTQVLSVAINENSKVVGLRSNSGGATVPFTYHYFFLDTRSSTPNGQTPFLISSTDDVEVIKTGIDRIEIQMKGEIYSFKNEAWTRIGDELAALKIDIIASYQDR